LITEEQRDLGFIGLISCLTFLLGFLFGEFELWPVGGCWGRRKLGAAACGACCGLQM
jgi:hypothetical protein